MQFKYLKKTDHETFFGALTSGVITDASLMEIYEKQGIVTDGSIAVNYF
jgi:hypothetical protein